MIQIRHNFDEKKFKWLWAKYVKDGNVEKHCTACLCGPYSKKFSGTSNQNLLAQPELVMNEIPDGDFKAIYFCGVIKRGYPRTNYPHNVHFAVVPAEGQRDEWNFEDWHVEIENGVLSPIPDEEQLDDRFFQEPYNDHFYTCRIFRWMVGFFYPQLIKPI